jgi:hypothetical protein
LAAALAAFGPVTPPLRCAKALAAAVFAALELEVARVLPALEAALLLVRSDIGLVLLTDEFSTTAD